MMSILAGQRRGWVVPALIAATVLLSPGWSSARNYRQPRNESATMEGDGLQRKFERLFPGAEVRVNERSRTISVSQSEDELPAPGVREGVSSKQGKMVYRKMVVKNRSYYTADIFWSLDDAVTPWYSAGSLKPFWKLKLRLARGYTYLLAAEAYPDEDEYWDWGPRSFFHWKKGIWTLYN